MDYAQHLAEFANILEQKRLVTGLEGNASVIDRETGLTYITPSGRMKLLLQPDDIAVMDADGNQVGAQGQDRRPDAGGERRAGEAAPGLYRLGRRRSAFAAGQHVYCRRQGQQAQAAPVTYRSRKYRQAACARSSSGTVTVKSGFRVLCRQTSIPASTPALPKQAAKASSIASGTRRR